MSQSQYAKLKPDQIDLGARRASIAIREQLKEIQKGIHSLPTPQNRNEIAPIVSSLQTLPTPQNRNESTWMASSLPTVSEPTEPFKVGIVGAGVAGLFTAMIFDYLNKEYQTNVEYEIMECNGKDRLGGRLYTHHFSDAEHDYYDVGAMRFPDIPVMKQTFALFNLLGMEKQPDAEQAKKGDLIPYYLQGPNNPQLYNDIQIVPPFKGVTAQNEMKKEKGPTANTFKVTGLEDWYADEEPATLIKDMVQPFTSKLIPNKEKPLAGPKRGWDFLLKFGDSYSVRQWFSKLYDHNTTEWLETYSYGTSWYDEALSEMVLEEVNFNAPLKDWWCVEGGSQEIAKRMAEKIENQKALQFGKRVVKMERLKHDTDKHKQGADNETIQVEVEGENSLREYDAVFNSAPLGAMQRMDLRGLKLNWGTKQAIRSLGYGASCKVGMKFKYRWWVEEKDLVITRGGVGKTDLPIRNCVYPSYNLTKKDASDPTKGEEGKKPGVLLCSYTWSQEAQRIGTLIHPEGGPETETELKALLIDNLARLHTPSTDNPANDKERYKHLKKLIGDAYLTHFAYDWYNDPGTTGAFAYFGPGQFGAMYPWIANRNDGNYNIIGEAASTHHAWVVGALESAVRGVYQFLFRHSKNSTRIAAALQAYHKSDKEGGIPAPYGPLPAEFDRTEDVAEALKPGEEVNEKRVAARGEWLRQGVLFETIRLKQERDQLDLAKVTAEEVAPLLDAERKTTTDSKA